VIDADVRQVEIKAWDRDGRRGQVVLDLDAGLEFLERFLPPTAQVGESPIVVAGDASGTLGLFFRHIVRKTASRISGVSRCIGAGRHPRFALLGRTDRKFLRFFGRLGLLRHHTLHPQHEDRCEEIANDVSNSHLRLSVELLQLLANVTEAE
jgi:hypothetical protein